MIKTKRFTLLESVVYHRMLWSELAETGIKFKVGADFWGQQKIMGCNVHNTCFACEYVSSCSDCLFVWSRACCNDPEAEYSRWCGATTIAQRKKWASKIRDLELRGTYKVILCEGM